MLALLPRRKLTFLLGTHYMEGKPDTTVKRQPLVGPMAVLIPLVGFFMGTWISSQRQGYESGEASLIHVFQFAAVFILGFLIAVALALTAILRREKYRWLFLAGVFLDYPIAVGLMHLVHP